MMPLNRLAPFVAAIATVSLPGAAMAQGVAVATQGQVQQIDKRVGILERQMKAVQRKVFPGDKDYFEPEIAPPAPAAPAGGPGPSPLTDLMQRVAALESQQRAFTGQIEQLQFQLRQLQQAQDKLRGDAEFRLNALEGKAPGTAPAAGAPPAAVAALPLSDAVAGGASAPEAVKTPDAKAPASKPAAPPAAGAAAGGLDPVEAAYRAGYAKYTARDYAGAAKDLTAFVEANPKHPRASNAQFWAGRAMLAQNQTAQAAKAFLAGYQNYPRGERAHNSLLWLARSLLMMNQPKAACQALDQVRTAYPDRLTGQFATDVAATRTQAKCPA
jgi:tol-pal system protein YbgF